MMITNGGRPLSILVVEDEEAGASSLAETLRLFGCRVTMAQTGSAGLREAEQNPPDVVLLDIHLPDRDGWDVARQMWDATSGVRQPIVVAITAQGEEKCRWHAADEGVDFHWVKPSDPRLLLATLARFVGVFNRLLGDPGGRKSELAPAAGRFASARPMPEPRLSERLPALP